MALADAHWTVEGHPDLSRVLTIDFLFEPCTAIRSGQVYLSDVSLVEPGGPVDIETSPLPVLVERLARRQWDALWSARNRSHGMIPNNSYQATDAGLNTTAAVLWMLPAATRRGWVQQAEADRYVESLAAHHRRVARSGQVSAAAQRGLDDAEALAAARGIVGRCGLPDAGAVSIQVARLDFARLAYGHRPDAEPFRFRRLFLPRGMAHGLPLPHAAQARKGSCAAYTTAIPTKAI